MNGEICIRPFQLSIHDFLFCFVLICIQFLISQPLVHVIPTTVVCVLSQTMPYLEGFQRHKCHLYVLLCFALTCWLVRKLPCFVVMAELSYRLTSLLSHSQNDLGGFHLHLLVFPFVYQFNSRIGVLVHSSFAND